MVERTLYEADQLRGKENNRSKLVDTLMQLGIIPPKYTGSIVVHMNDGSICKVEIHHQIKL